MSSPLGTLDIVSGGDQTFSAPSDGHKAILIGNESGLTVTITMESGGVSKTLYPGVLDWFAIKRGFTGNIKVHPVSILNNVSSWPASTLIFDAIGLQDPEEAYMYPISFNRNTNIGNAVTAVGGTSSSIINDNNAPATQFIEATATGDGASAVSLTNSGDLVLGNATHKGSISSDNATFKTDGSGNVNTNNLTVAASKKITTPEVDSPAVTDLVENVPTGQAIRFKVNSVEQGHIDATGLSAIGHIDIATNNTSIRAKDNAGTLRDILYVDAANATDIQAAALNGVVNVKNQDGSNYLILDSGKLGISADGDILDAGSSTVTYLKARSAGSINFQTPNGSTQATIDSTGLTFPSGNGWKGATGDFMARTNSVNNGSGSGTNNHGLGATPDGVIIYVHHLNSSATTGYDSETSTQFHATLGAALTWNAFLYKRT